MFQKVITSALWAILMASATSTAEATSGTSSQQDEGSLGNSWPIPRRMSGDDSKVTMSVAIILVVLIVVLFLIIGVVFWIRRKEARASASEEKKDAAFEVKEWIYRDGAETKGPFTNQQMRKFWVAGIINRGTEAKVVWWTQDFEPVSHLFPQVGSEFTLPAKAAEEGVEARKSDWHRFSVLAQPGAGHAWSLNWYYQLPDGKQEGPFETGKMRHWFIMNFFESNTLVRYEGAPTLDFKPLQEHFPNLAEAFDVLPKGCSSAQARQSMKARSSQVRNSQLRCSMQSAGSPQALANSPGLQAELAELGASANLPKDVQPWRASNVVPPRASVAQTVGKEML